MPNSAAMSKIVVAFDLYGTLLSTASIARELAAHAGEDRANSIAALWRRYQLEYTWRMNSMRKSCPQRSQGNT
jgi:2-haloacid dehalogenase